MNPLISVIVPVYNTELYVSRAIDSILNQSYDNIEIICVDDGSTDNSPGILDEYAAKYDNIKVFHTENKGISHARNLALDYCHGEYIAFLDSDDMYHEQMLQILYNAMVERECDFSACKVVNYRDSGVDKLSFNLPEKYDITVHNGKEIMEYHYSLDREKMENIVLVCLKLYKRKIWENIRFPIGRIYEDNAVMHLLSERTNKFAIVPLELYYRYIREDSIMGQSKKFTIRNFDILYNQKERCDYFEKDNNEFIRPAYREYLHTLRVMYSCTKDSSLNNKDICPKLTEEYKKYYEKVRNLRVYSVKELLKEKVAGIVTGISCGR